MHPIHRLFCRAYQTVFRIALPILPYREPKLLDSADSAALLLREKQIDSILLVADGGVRDLGLTKPLESALKANGISCAVYEQRTPNPTIDNVEAARALYARTGAKAIIAIGGGSAIDCAKVAGARIARPKTSVRRMRGILRILLPTPLMIAVPTTAGTGSETTLTAVITDSKTHHKYPISDFPLIPDYALLDEKLTLGLPPHITATTGMDALTHAVEAYIGRSTNRYTRAMAEEAVTLISENLIHAYENGQDETVRKNLLRASYCAGNAFTRSYVGYVHGAAHALGGQYGVAHGLANAVILPHFLRAYGSACHAKLAALARITELAGPEDSDRQASETFIRWIEGLNRYFGLPEGFACIRREDIPRLAANAARECNPLYPVPKLMNRIELEGMFESLMIKEDTP